MNIWENHTIIFKWCLFHLYELNIMQPWNYNPRCHAKSQHVGTRLGPIAVITYMNPFEITTRCGLQRAAESSSSRMPSDEYGGVERGASASPSSYRVAIWYNRGLAAPMLDDKDNQLSFLVIKTYSGVPTHSVFRIHVYILAWWQKWRA